MVGDATNVALNYLLVVKKAEKAEYDYLIEFAVIAHLLMNY